MLGYDYYITYRKGAQNLVADALSRKAHEFEGQFLQCVGRTTWSDLWNRVVESTVADPKLYQICMELLEDPQKHPKYSWNGQVLRRKGKAVVGNDIQLRRELFECFHCSPLGGHSGAHATKVRLSGQVY